MSYYAKMSEDEKKWRQRDDARVLAQAEQIKADKERYQGAIIGAKEIASEEIKQAESIAKVAGMKLPKVPKNEVPSNTAQRGFQQAVPNTTVTPQFKPRRDNPATIGRL